MRPQPHPDKEPLREALLARRDALPGTERAAASVAIQRRIESLPVFRRATGVHCYVSMRTEVETEGIFRACWARGKSTFVPFQIREPRGLGWSLRKPGDRLPRGPFGVPEPEVERRSPANGDKIDLILVPGVAFDRSGDRLGYGKGFYDIFLSSLLKTRVKQEEGYVSHSPAIVGLAFSLQMVDSIPQDSWDVRMEKVVTEGEIIEVG